jgi:antitoxin (DNA-binding transcriptional repressor) of toxin-antitoxin stability system
MRAVGIKALKDKLSEYVRLAAGGETILVTDRERVVAELRPPRPDRSTWLADAQLAEAVRQGWVTPPTEPRTEPPEGLPVAPLAELLTELDADRADR